MAYGDVVAMALTTPRSATLAADFEAHVRAHTRGTIFQIVSEYTYV